MQSEFNAVLIALEEYKPKKFEYMEKNTEGFGQCKAKKKKIWGKEYNYWCFQSISI